jgi:transcriptional regulator with XRE-family HTH domain
VVAIFTMTTEVRPMTPLDLCIVGQTLYGPSWRAALADALGVSERTIRRWANGEFPIPEHVAGELAALCEGRAIEIETARRDILSAAGKDRGE